VSPAAQSSIYLIWGKGVTDKITKPLAGLIVAGMIGVLERSQKFCESLRPSTVFGRTTSFTCHACLLKRFVSQQNFFKKKVVLPAIPEIVLVQ